MQPQVSEFFSLAGVRDSKLKRHQLSYFLASNGLTVAATPQQVGTSNDRSQRCVAVVWGNRKCAEELLNSNVSLGMIAKFIIGAGHL